MRITEDTLHGRVVLTSDGLAIGEVNKLFLQGAQFAIDTVEVKLRKEFAERLEVTRTMFHPATIEIPARLVQSVGDAVLLAVPFGELLALRPTEETEGRPLDSSSDMTRDRPVART
jgi:sporulation protein YlmC with PRC-barrel domain